MKKLRVLFLSFIILSLITASASAFTGSTRTSLLDASSGDISTTLYAPDGNSVKAYPALVGTLLDKGWERELEDVIVTLYSEDGRTLRVFKSETETYLKLGWFRSYQEVIKTLYAPDGRTLTVYKSEVEPHLKLGWFGSYEEVITTLYAPGNRTLTVYNSEVDTYLKLGWFIKKPIDPAKPTVALTFDDGPNPTNTVRIIDTLVKYDVTGTFFVLGNLAARYPDVVRYAASSGMEIASHTYSHPRLTALYSTGITKEFSLTSEEIMLACGTAPSLIRPPYGAYNETVKASSPAPLIMWSVDTLDWKSRNATSVYNAVMNTVKDGDIILMHDIYGSTADAVELIVPELIRRGFQITGVSELAKARGIPLENGQIYYRLK